MTKARNIADLGSNDVIETTATGVDVTGTVTADGLTVDGNSNLGIEGSGSQVTMQLPSLSSSYPTRLVIEGDYNSGTSDVDIKAIGVPSGGPYGANLNFYTSSQTSVLNRMKIANNGDVSFYEDTGTTAKMVWDASAERLGIGTASPWETLSIPFNEKLSFGSSTYPFSIGRSSAGELITTIEDGYDAPNTRIDFKMRAGSANENTALSITGAGNVGIGTVPKTWQSQSNALEIGEFSIEDYEISGSNATNILFNGYRDTDNSFKRKVDGYSVRVGSYLGDFAVQLYGNGSADEVLTGSPAMRLDSSGNLLVGKSSANNTVVGIEAKSNGNLSAVADGITPALFRRKTSDGDIVEFAKDGSTVGSIGTTTAGNFAFYSPSEAGIETSAVGILPMNDGIRADNQVDLGYTSARWDDIYATNGTIQTSDRNEKQDIEVLSDAEQRVAQACKGLLRKFRWKDSVAEKGDDARIHFGIIAQDLQDAFTAEGLDAGRYAMFISSTWTDEETGEERTRLGVRYPELLAFIISAL